MYVFQGTKILLISNLKQDVAFKAFKKHSFKFLVKEKKSYSNNSNKKKKSLTSVHICFNEVQKVRRYTY